MWHIFKKLFIPSGNKVAVVAYKSWVVRWQGYSSFSYSGGSYSLSAKEHVEIFPNEEDARSFARQLAYAHQLLQQHGNATGITVKENHSSLSEVTI